MEDYTSASGRLIRMIVSLVASAGAATFRETFAEALELPVNTYFSCSQSGAVRLYKRISAAPGYRDLGDTAANLFAETAKTYRDQSLEATSEAAAHAMSSSSYAAVAAALLDGMLFTTDAAGVAAVDDGAPFVLQGDGEDGVFGRLKRRVGAAAVDQGISLPALPIPATGIADTAEKVMMTAEERNKITRVLTVTSGSGEPNAITATATPALTALFAGLKVSFRVAAANTDVVTLAVDGTAATSLRSNSGGALAAGDLILNRFYTATYDGALWILDTKAAASAVVGSTNTADFVTPSQLSAAVSRATVQLSSAGSANAITATATPSLAALPGYQLGMQATLRSTPGNNTGNVTLNIDGLGDLQLVSHSGNQLPSGALRSTVAHPFSVTAAGVARLFGPVRAVTADLARASAASATDRYLTPADGLTLIDALAPYKPLRASLVDNSNPNAQVFSVTPEAVAFPARGTLLQMSFAAIPTTNAFTIDVGAGGAGGVVDMAGNAVGTNLVVGTYYLLVSAGNSWRIVNAVKPSDAMITGRSGELRPTVSQVNTMIGAALVSVPTPIVAGADVSTNDWLLAGDSLTWRQGSTALGSTGEFGSILLGEQVYNAGYSGQTSTQIAERMNAQPVTITIAGGTVPASGAVACTLSGTGNPLAGTGVGAQLITIDPGGLNLVGTLTRTPATADYTFTRSASGSTVSVPGSTAIRFDVSYGMRNRAWAIRVGRNNITQSATILADIDAILAVQTGKVRRTIIETIPSFPNGSGGAESNLAAVQARNAEIIARYGLVQDGGMVLDTLSYLLDTGPFGALATVGVTPTSDDLTDIAAGIPPRALRAASTDGHFNDVGYAALDRMRVRWILRGGFWR